ncbi:MAG: mercuric reductase [Fuerstiella sp.]|jgi:pyruvate/2-oxoglutarate dehydrogenase complex dihydrolipoamide dehydrogenase (E3) component|nr:mercuric reductase [Fuerstiella sp.]
MSSLPQLHPLDQHNQLLQSHVAPLEWQNPSPCGRYNLVVIGAGPAGLVTAAGAAGLGAKVALIERNLMGGDCLNVGCVPSKGIISAARAAAAVRESGEFGIEVPDGWNTDFSKVMDRMRRLRAGMSHHDAAARFMELGIDVYFGGGKFVSNDTVEVKGQQLNFKRAVICTGARAADLPIPGLQDVGALTNETLFSLTQLPARMAVIGGGPIGSEMAQSFARFGCEVTQIEKAPYILPHEDPDAALVVQQSMERDGIQFVLNAQTTRMEKRGDETVVTYEQDGQEHQINVDKVLVGIGRTPNVDGLGLEAVGVKYDSRRGIEINDHLQTTNPMIYAAGDVCSRHKFTHSADFMARIVIQNTLFKGRAKASTLTVPWCTYTSPELAHVGMGAKEAAAQDIEVDTYTVKMKDNDRAILEADTVGFVRAHVRKGTDEIVGATIVAANAGDMINEITLAMTVNSRIPKWKKTLRLARGVGLSSIGTTIHPYPTQAEAIRKLGDQYSRTRLTPFVQKLFRKWLAWTR